MAGQPIRHLRPPEITRRSNRVNRRERKVSNWILPWDNEEEIDVGILGCPYGRSASGSVGADEAANTIRLAFPRFRTYDPYHDVDISFLKVRDLGEILEHASGVVESHRHIAEAITDLLECRKIKTLIIIGGDHSVTAPIMRGLTSANSTRRGGLVYFDAHADATELLDGYPHNAPLRPILEEGLVAGEDVIHIGMASFGNALYYRRWLEGHHVTIIPQREVHTRGIGDIMRQAREVAGERTDWTYVSLDIDVMGQEYAPATGAGYPGGLGSLEILEAVEVVGQWSNLVAMDIVEVAPPLDLGLQTVKLATSIMLHFLLGVALRKENEDRRKEASVAMAQLGEESGAISP